MTGELASISARAQTATLRGRHSVLDDLNPHSKEGITACLVLSLCNAQPEKRFRFERHGYFVADRRDTRPGKPVLNRTVTLRDSWTKGG